MIEPQQGSARSFVELAYNESSSMIQQNSERITISRASLPELSQDFNIICPKHVRLSRVATILPLLEALGVEKFLLILSAVLCERRILLIADETSTLLTAVLALGAMLHPFQWQHMFIPLLPSKLLNYTAFKIPYIIGVRRFMYQQLLREQLDDVILVDIDKGDYRVVGGVCIRDFVGESGNALKQATESLDRVRQRASDMANMFLRNTGATSATGAVSDSDNGHRDIVAIIMSDLRAALVAKPGGSSVSAVATGLFRGLPGGVKSTVEESKGVWNLETEKLLRDLLLQFFATLFADIEDFISPGQVQQDGTVKALFDRNGFMNRRGSASSGDARAMLEFLSDFSRSKMFSKFCDGKLAEKKEREAAESSSSGWGRGSGLPSMSSNGSDEEDDFHAVCSDLRNKQMINSVVNVRLSVAARTAFTASALNIDSSNAGCKGMVGMDFHSLTVQFTLGQKDDASDASESAAGPAQQAIDRICAESHCTDAFSKIMNTITLRLENCKAATCRGTGGQIGVRALNLLRALLISGPECVLSCSVDYIPVIRVILSQCGGGGPAPQGLEFMGLGPVVDIRVIALAVLSLLLDHKKLSHQRKYSSQCREGVYSYIYLQSYATATSLFCPSNHQKMHKRTSESLRRDLFLTVTAASSSSSTKQFPGFQSLLTALKPPGALNADPSRLRLSEPVEASSEKREDDEEDDTNDAESHSTRESTAPLTVQIKSTVVNLLDDSFDDSPSQPPCTPSLNPMISASAAPHRYSPTFTPSRSSFQASIPAPIITAPAPLVEVFEDDAIYRIVNRDTGEVNDLRDLDKMMSMTRVVSTPLKHVHVPTLAPPPPPGQTRRPPYRAPAPVAVSTGSGNTPRSNGSSDISAYGNGNGNGTSQRPKPADPFASLTPLIPNSPMRAPQNLAQTSSSSFTPSYSMHSSPSAPFGSSSSTSYMPPSSSGMMGFNANRPANDFIASSSAASNPFEGFAHAPAFAPAPAPAPAMVPFQSPLTPRSTPLTPRSTPVTPRGTLGINPQHAARDKGESPGPCDPFADLLGNIKN